MPLTAEQRAKGVIAAQSPEAKTKRELTFYKRRFRSAYKELIKFGMTQTQIENVFSMGKICDNRKSTAELHKAHIEAMDILEAQLAGRMIVQAIGYDYEEEKTSYTKDKSGLWMAMKKERFKKHQPGNSTMFTLLMTNRFSDRWKVSRETINKKEEYDSEPSQRVRKQIKSLARDILERDTSQQKLVKGIK